MDKLELQKLRDLPIEGVAERLGLQVKQHKALCPFHDDHHASLSFSVSRNTFRCFVCGATGGTIDLVMKRLGKDFLDACRWLADEHNVIISSQPSTPLSTRRGDGGEVFCASRYERFFEHPWLNDEAQRFLYQERHIDPRVVRWCRLTSWRDKQGTPWLQIPYYDREGRLIGLQNRNLTPNPSPKERGEKNATPLGKVGGGFPKSEVGGGFPRFRFPKGAECSIYNLPVLNRLRAGEDLYITEGCSDCWAMLSSGHKAIAIPSATLLKPKDTELLATLHSQLSTQFHMYPDNDTPGEHLFLQLKQRLPNLQHHHLPPGCKDYGEMFVKLKIEN